MVSGVGLRADRRGCPGWLGLRGWGLGFGGWGVGFRVLGERVSGFGCRVWGLRSSVSGLAKTVVACRDANEVGFLEGFGVPVSGFRLSQAV